MPSATRYSLLFLLLASSAMRTSVAPAQEADAPAGDEAVAERFIDQTPFDEVLLKDGTSIKTELLKLPNRRLPENPRSTDKLTVQIFDNPGEDFEITWRDIERVRLFEMAILEQGQEYARQGRLADAYEYLDYLERRYPKAPGVKEAVERLIYQDAQASARRREFEYVLILLNQLHLRNPEYPGLDRALGVATESLVSQQIAGQRFREARTLVQQLVRKFPEDAQAKRMQQRLQSMAEQYLAEAQQQADDGQMRRAQDLCLQALDIWPALKPARELASRLYAEYPYVAVGVSQPAVNREQRIDDWGSRRAARLLNVPLMEFTGFGAEGGNYICPVGGFEKEDLGLRLTFHLRTDIQWPDGSPLIGFDVARTLLEGEGGSSANMGLWAPLLDRVQVNDVFSVDVHLKRAHVYPEALFDIDIVPPAQLPSDATLGPFELAARDEQESVYLPSTTVLGNSQHLPREIVERSYTGATAALEGLRRLEVSIVDRLNPWELQNAKEIENTQVGAYAVPSVHCLLPNLNHPLLGNRTFRRALMYGMHRESILRVQLLRGAELAGARVLSGPFPNGYAYNNAVEVKPYEPRVAMMLMFVALSELDAEELSRLYGDAAPADSAVSSGPTPEDDQQNGNQEDASPDTASQDDDEELDALAQPQGRGCPPLVLAHPADDVARLACRTIQRQLALIKIPITLVELKPGEVALPGSEYDLVYATLQIDEPLVDVHRLFGPHALLPPSSPYLRTALERVALASDWKGARDALLEVHRIVADEAAILPLYQLPEFYAYRRAVQGIGEQPAALYQNVSSWRISPELPAEN